METARVGDIIIRSDGKKYAIIIDNDFLMPNVTSEVIQLPQDSTLARNLIGARVGDYFNYGGQLKIEQIIHTDYQEKVDKQKALMNRIEKHTAETERALNEFDFQLAEELNRQSRIKDYEILLTEAIRKFKKMVYDSAYYKSERRYPGDLINKAINSGVISNSEIVDIVGLAEADKKAYERRQAQERSLMRIQRQHEEAQRQRKLCELKRLEEEEKKRKEREAKEKEEKEQRKRNNYRNVIAEREIKELIHFTNIKNIRTIKEYGILPRSIVDKKLPNAIVNDTNRFDGYRNAVCLSVSFPNYKMFYKYQKENEGHSWAVISLKPELLADFGIKYFYFFPENAAKNSSSRCTFDEMFGNSSGCEPENPQAEILAFGTVPSGYIQKIYVRTTEDKRFLEQEINNSIIIEVNAKYFNYRTMDYL